MTLQVAGNAALLYGNNKPQLRSEVQSACDSQGWNKMVNRPPSKHASLERAVQTVGNNYSLGLEAPLSVRALEQDLAFEATRVQRGTTRNVVTHLFSAQVDAAGQVSLVSWNPAIAHATLLGELQQEYDSNLNYLTPTQTRTVVRNVVRRLGGIPLGGPNVYYLPPGSVQTWHTWRDAAKLYSYHATDIGVAQDPNTVKHILDSLNVEVTPAATAILEAVATGNLEPRQAKALIRKARVIIEKIKSYESALGQQLEWMRDPLEQAEQALAVSSLLSVSA